MSGFSLFLIGLAFALGIIVGVYIDTDVVIKGKIKQKTGKGGRSNIQDIKTDVNVKKQTRKEKKEAKKQRREWKRNINNIYEYDRNE